MNKKVLLIAAFSGFAVSSFAQSIQFRIETDQIVAGGETIGLDNPGTYKVLGATVSSIDVLNNDFNAVLDSIASGTDNATALQSFLLGDTFAADGWTEIDLSAGFGPFAAYDWYMDVPQLTIGNVPVMAVVSQSVNDLTNSDFIGLVTTSSTSVPELGNIPIGFSATTNKWDTAVIGDLGSLTLTPVSAVPEPSHYAAALGLLGLGLVIWRRRRQ